MSGVKIAILVIYAALVLVLLLGGEPAASYAAYTFGVLALVHLAEVILFYRRCQQAGGSLPVHLLNVLLFGVFHLRELDRTA